MRFDKDSAPEIVYFDGVKYRRMGGKRKYYLSQSSTNAGRKNPKGLHVAVWEHHNGQPVGHGNEVNHRDGDVFNFSPENLERLPKDTHRKLPKINIDREANRKHLEKCRSLASAWHKSVEGRAWHREVTAKHLDAARAARIIGDERPTLGLQACEWCGGLFSRRSARRLLCSTACQTAKSRYVCGKRTHAHPHYAARLQPDS